ncbi:hypothetical protein APSETT444_000073 [Aspergillus pseudonomiae]
MSQQPRSDDGIPGDFEHPNQNLRRSIIITLYFAFILSTTAVALRLLARRMNGTRLYLDDYLILLALLSILALYKRLFSTPRMILAANIVAGFVILWGLSVCVVGILLCLPVKKFWDPTVPGSCLDSAQYYYGQQIPNILTDAVLLVMPLKFVWALPISKTQRLLLSGVFVTGGFFWSQLRSGTGHSKQPLNPSQDLSMQSSNYDPYFTQTNIYARHSVSIHYSKP